MDKCNSQRNITQPQFVKPQFVILAQSRTQKDITNTHKGDDKNPKKTKTKKQRQRTRLPTQSPHKTKTNVLPNKRLPTNKMLRKLQRQNIGEKK